MRHGSTRVGFLAVLLALLALPVGGLAQQPGLSDDRLGTRTAPLLLLTRQDIRADLRLTPEQAAAADRMIQDLYRRAEAIRGKGNTPEAIAERRAIDDAQREGIRAILSPEQQSRLVQLDLQWEGPSALVTRRALSEALGLSAEQVGAIQAAVNARRAQGPNRPDAERTLAEKTLAVLTPEQRERWKTLLGRPFAVQVAQGARPPAR
jgi:hypothetical protein